MKLKLFSVYEKCLKQTGNNDSKRLALCWGKPLCAQDPLIVHVMQVTGSGPSVLELVRDVDRESSANYC